MLSSHYYEMPTGWALAVVAGLLGISIGLSLLFPQKKRLVPEVEDESG
jgi:hypothetical protein